MYAYTLDEFTHDNVHLVNLVKEFTELFEPVKYEPGILRFGGVTLTIQLIEGAKPFSAPPFRLSPIEMEQLAKILDKYKSRNWIAPCNGPWASPTFLVPKKSCDEHGQKEYRMVIDYRQLNKRTFRKSYPLPKIDTLFDRLVNCVVFSSLDLESGYHQIVMDDAAAEMAAFITPCGVFKPLVLPFGLHSAPSTFQMAMEVMLESEIKQGFVFPYLDDVLVFSRNAEEHLQHLEQLFQVLKANNCRLRLDKCKLMQFEVPHLGHIVSGEGIKVDPTKISAIQAYPPTKVCKIITKVPWYGELLSEIHTLLCHTGSSIE